MYNHARERERDRRAPAARYPRCPPPDTRQPQGGAAGNPERRSPASLPAGRPERRQARQSGESVSRIFDRSFSVIPLFAAVALSYNRSRRLACGGSLGETRGDHDVSRAPAFVIGSIRVVLADVSPAGRKRIRRTLMRMSDVFLAGEATGAPGFLRAARRNGPAVIVIRSTLARPDCCTRPVESASSGRTRRSSPSPGRDEAVPEDSLGIRCLLHPSARQSRAQAAVPRPARLSRPPREHPETPAASRRLEIRTRFRCRARRSASLRRDDVPLPAARCISRGGDVTAFTLRSSPDRSDSSATPIGYTSNSLWTVYSGSSNFVYGFCLFALRDFSPAN